jgi:hypothetical protein
MKREVSEREERKKRKKKVRKRRKVSFNLSSHTTFTTLLMHSYSAQQYLCHPSPPPSPVTSHMMKSTSSLPIPVT